MQWERLEVDGRAGALKTDWTEPPQDAGPMGIESLAETRRKASRPVAGGFIAVGVGRFAIAGGLKSRWLA
jgi:hypothetical protein